MSFGTFLLWAKCEYPSNPLIPTETCRGDSISMQQISWSALNNQPREDSWVTETSPLLFLLPQSLCHKTTQLHLKAQHWVWVDTFFLWFFGSALLVGRLSQILLLLQQKRNFLPNSSWPVFVTSLSSLSWLFFHLNKSPLQELPVIWVSFFCLSYAFVR